MTRGNGSKAVSDGAESAGRANGTKIPVHRFPTGNGSEKTFEASRNGGGNRPGVEMNAVLGMIHHAYIRLLAGHSFDAQRTLERVLASQEVATLGGAVLNTARLIQGMKPPGNAASFDGERKRWLGCPGSARVIVRTLGKFEVTVDGKNPGSRRKPPYRPLGMLKVLIANGGCAVSEGAVVDALWPDLDGDHAHDARQVALHRLRKLLGSTDAIAVRHGRMFIDDDQVWVDSLALETLTRASVPGGSREKAEIALDLYQGVFLPQEIDAPWTSRLRECLRAKFVNVVAKAAVELESKGQFSEAASLFERGLAIDDLDKVLHTGLVRCLKQASPPGVNQTKS